MTLIDTISTELLTEKDDVDDQYFGLLVVVAAAIYEIMETVESGISFF